MNDDQLLDALQREFQERLRRNPRYSLRAFARSLGIDQSLLSKILTRKRSIGAPTRLLLNRQLELSPPTEALASPPEL